MISYTNWYCTYQYKKTLCLIHHQSCHSMRKSFEMCIFFPVIVYQVRNNFAVIYSKKCIITLNNYTGYFKRKTNFNWNSLYEHFLLFMNIKINHLKQMNTLCLEIMFSPLYLKLETCQYSLIIWQ